MSILIPTSSNLQSVIEDDVYYFSHVPKTGGTSFTTILDRYFDVSEIFKPQLWWEVGDVSVVKEKNFKCFRGHFGMGAQVLSEHPLKTLTLLRSPLRMAYSTYQYIKRETNTGKHQYVVSNQLTFEDFVQDPNTQNLCKNRLLKSLCFGSSMLNLDQKLVITPENFKAQRKLLNKDAKQMSAEQVYAMVKTYIDSCYWVGLLEDFERSLMLLCHKMAVPFIGATQKLNTHPHEPLITEKAANIINELNQLDNELYAYARFKFEKEFEKAFSHLLADADSIKSTIDKKYQKQHFQRIGGELNEQVDYQFSMPLIGENWHNREWSESESAYFRWTGPVKTTSIDFWLKPNNYLIELNYINIANQGILEELEMSINGMSVEYRKEGVGSSGMLIINCKKSNFRPNGLMRLVMKTKRLKTHHENFNSHDNRRVGFAVKSIKIKKVWIK